MTSDLVMYLDPERDGFYIKIRHFASGTRKTCYFFTISIKKNSVFLFPSEHVLKRNKL